MHIDGVFPTMETGHGTVHMEMNNPQMNIVSESTYETHFVSSSCGSVPPGKTEMVR
jgi:transcription antitermination factor NusG